MSACFLASRGAISFLRSAIPNHAQQGGPGRKQNKATQLEKPMAKLDHIEFVYRGEIGDGAPLEVFSSLRVYPGAGSKAPRMTAHWRGKPVLLADLPAEWHELLQQVLMTMLREL
jgi:hypothetical protein